MKFCKWQIGQMKGLSIGSIIGTIIAQLLDDWYRINILLYALLKFLINAQVYYVIRHLWLRCVKIANLEHNAECIEKEFKN